MTRAEKAGLYNRLKRRMGYAELILGLTYLIVLLVSGWTFDLRNLALSLGGGPVLWVLTYFVLAALIFNLLALPLSVLSGYFLERRFGLINQSPAKWAADFLKAQALGLVLGAVAVESLYLCFRWAGSWWWLPAGGAFALFFILLAQITPILILPLFFKFRGLPDNDLTRRLKALCHRSGTQVLGIYEWGLSARTRKANAALVGWGPTRRVVLSDSLLKDFTPSEIEVILAHELGHFRLGHLKRLMALQVGLTLAAFLIADRLFRSLGPALGFDHLSDVAGLPLLILVFVGTALAALPLVNMVSRRLERQADYFALSLTGLVGSFLAAMEHLAALNLAETDPHPLVEFMFHSHPSPAKRIRAAKNYMYRQMKKSDALH